MTRVSISEIAALARFRADLERDGRRGVLAHLVAVDGSHYRRPGARMIFAEDGSAAGSISGGCLEADLARQWGSVLAEERPRMVTYDLRGSEDLVWGTGLGCAGRVEILLSPLDRAGGVLESASAAEGTAILATAVEDGDFALGEQALLADGERRAGSSRLARVVARGEPRDGVLVEELEPPLRLLVGGAGEDVVPIVSAAGALGWDVRIFSPRPTERARERFPGLPLLPASEIAAHAGAGSAALVATHGYFDDLELLRALAGSGTPYVGLLGAKERVERLMADCGDILGDGAGRRIFGPAGLDIGADTPGEMALSIVAEIHAVVRGRAGGSLRDRRERIHDRAVEGAPPGSEVRAHRARVRAARR